MDEFAAQPSVAPGDLLAVLDHLDTALARPLANLAARMQRLDAATLGPADDDAHDHARTMIGLCDELTGLTREIAEFAAISSGAHHDDPITTRLSHLVAEVNNRYACQAVARGLVWSCVLEGQDAEVTVEPARFRQSVALTVPHALHSAGPGTVVRFEIARTAIGWHWILTTPATDAILHDESLHRALEPLAAKSIAREKSTPAGMESCCDMIESIGGRVEVCREKTFHQISVTFPTRKDH